MAQHSYRFCRKISPVIPVATWPRLLFEPFVDVEEEAPMIGASGDLIGLR